MSESDGLEYSPPMEVLRVEAAVHASLLTWLMVHGNLQLALRHPANAGPSRQLIVTFLKHLGPWLVENKVLTAEQLEESKRQERQG